MTGSKRKPTPLAKRLAQAKQRGAALSHVKKTKLTVAMRVPLDVYEMLVELGEKAGGESVSHLAYRCMVDGLRRFGKTHRMNMRLQPFEDDSFGVFDRHPELANAHRDYGNNEGQARDNLREAVEKNRDDMASELHLPGRRRATAG